MINVLNETQISLQEKCLLQDLGTDDYLFIRGVHFLLLLSLSLCPVHL